MAQPGVEMTQVDYYFDLKTFRHRALFADISHVWEALTRIKPYMAQHLRPEIAGTVMEGAFVSESVYLGPGSVVEPGAMIKGPAIIGANCVIRHGAYIREFCILGDGCVVGHASELKGVIMLDGSQAPHFNYVGDSILGRRVNLGAGTKLSNLKNDRSEIVVHIGGQDWATGLQKFGAIIGDDSATGCNCVCSPGTLVGQNVHVYANALLRGAFPSHSIVKLRQHLEVVERHA